MFCPFTKEDCNPDCVFNNEHSNNNPDSCNINNTLSSMQSEIQLETYIKNIDTLLRSIQSNTSMNKKIRNIEELLEDINNKLDKPIRNKRAGE